MKVGSITTWTTGKGDTLVEIVVGFRMGWVRRRKHWIAFKPYSHDVGLIDIAEVRVICE